MNLIDMLPSFYHNSDFVKAYMSSQSVEHNFIKESIEDLVNNLYVNTATWGLDYFEEELGLKTDKSKSYEERRERIKAKKIGNVEGYSVRCHDGKPVQNGSCATRTTQLN